MSLSRRALTFAAAIILLAIIGVWSGEPLYGFWRWPAALLLLFIAWERVKLVQDIVVRRELARTLPLGETNSYTLTVRNNGKKAVTLETQADYPAALQGDNALQRWQVKPGETQIRSQLLVPTALGSTPLGSLYLRRLGAFGLCWWTRCSDDNVATVVEPALLQHGSAAGNARAGLRRHCFKAGNGSELLELRDYRHGDALRSIDWKATARRGKPVVWRFEREQRLEIVLLIDCGRASRIHVGQMDRLHHYVNVAARLAQLAAQQDDHVACLAYAQQPLAGAPMGSDIAAVQRIRRLLGNLSATAEESNPLGAALEVKRLIKRRGLVVFLTDIEQPEAASQLLQAVHLLASKHQVLVASLQDEGAASIAQQAAEQWLDPYRQFAALEYLRGRELTQRKLQRGGVAVVSAVPRQLDRQVLDYYRLHRGSISG